MKKLNNKIKLIKKEALWCSALVLAAVIFSGVNVAMAEWREPDQPPVTEQFPAPLTAGTENQAKEGYLLLDPTYNPTEATSLNFSIKRPLEVKGEGAEFSTPYVYNDILSVGDQTLYADSYNDWVGIGTTQFTSDVKLKVSGGIVQITADTTALSGYSDTSAGIYGDAGTLADGAGVYGYRAATDGWAVYGESTNNVGVRGESIDGSGIYATTQASLSAAVYGSNIGSGWAGYFDGILGAGSDVVSDRFLPTGLQRSLIPFTAGQEVGSYSIGTWTNYPDTVRLVFDGTHVWTVTNDRGDANHNLFKTRASDGAVAGSFTVGNPNHNAIAFDGTYIWIVPTSSEEVFRFDPRDESYATLDNDVAGFSQTTKESLAVSSIDGTAYVWTSDPLDGVGGKIIKINSSDLSFETFDLDNIITGLTNPDELTFDGTYLWVIADQGGQKKIVRLLPADPTSDPLVVDTSLLGCDPDDVYADGEYVWCLENTTNELLRIWAEDPNDTRHPMESFGPLGGADDQDMVFDGTYLWVVDYTSSKLYRYLAADPTVRVEFDLSFQPKNIIFDGTYLWITQADGDKDPILHKIYSGTGMGHTDLSGTVKLDPASQQTGSMAILGSGTVSGDTTVGADVIATTNTWGGSDEIVSVSGSVAECATEGYFIKGITLDANSEISEIVCRGL